MVKKKEKPNQKMQAWIGARKRFGKERPDVVLSSEDKICRDEEKKARKHAAKPQRRQAETTEQKKPEASYP